MDGGWINLQRTSLLKILLWSIYFETQAWIPSMEIMRQTRSTIKIVYIRDFLTWRLSYNIRNYLIIYETCSCCLVIHKTSLVSIYFRNQAERFSLCSLFISLDEGRRRDSAVAFAFRARELSAWSSIKITSGPRVAGGSNDDDNEASSQRRARRNAFRKQESGLPGSWRGAGEKKRNGATEKTRSRQPVTQLTTKLFPLIARQVAHRRGVAATALPAAFSEPYDAKFFARSPTQAEIWLRAPKCAILERVYIRTYAYTRIHGKKGFEEGWIKERGRIVWHV